MLTVLTRKKTLNLRVWLALAGWLLLPQILVSSPCVDGTTAVAARTTTYGWDAWDRLREVKVPTSATAQKTYRYSYDYRMRRIAMAQTGGGLTTRHTAVLYSGGLSVVEYNRTNNNTITDSTLSSMQYVRGPDMGGGVGGLLYTFRRSGESLVQRFNLSNGRGDIVAQTSNTGALTWTASYEAYGKQTKETGTNNDRQRANSKEEDPTGLLNEGHRYRDLETGVWMSRDPAGFVDGPNLYAYVRQNPWTSFDPDGLSALFGGQLLSLALDAKKQMQVQPPVPVAPSNSSGMPRVSGNPAAAMGPILMGAGNHSSVTSGAKNQVQALRNLGLVTQDQTANLQTAIDQRKSRGGAAQFMQHQEINNIINATLKGNLSPTDSRRQEAERTDILVNRIGGGSVENLRLKEAEKKLTPPGISVLLAVPPEVAAEQMRGQFPKATGLINASQVTGVSSLDAVRSAGFDVMPDSTARFPNHGRLISPQGVAGFSDTNLQRLSSVFTNVPTPSVKNDEDKGSK